MPRNRVAKSKAKRSHNLGGCGTCRRRHVKCDQQRPQCATCGRAGLECEGFPPRIRWASAPSRPVPASGVRVRDEKKGGRGGSGPDLSQIQVSRSAEGSQIRPLDSALDDERDAVDASLAELEHASRDVDNLRRGALTAGPFGVLNLDTALLTSSEVMVESTPTKSAHPTSPLTSNAASSLTRLDTESENRLDSTCVGSLSGISARSSSDLDSIVDVDNILEWHDLFDTGFDFAPMMYESSSTHEDPLQVLTHIANQTAESAPCVNNSMAYPCASSTGRSSFPQPCELQDSDRTKSATEPEALIAAPTLLRYFRDEVIVKFGPLPMTPKSPWKVCVCMAAVQAFAEITVMQNPHVTHASKALLFGVLAISAYHVGKSELDESLLSRVESERIYSLSAGKAKAYLQDSLRTEISGVHKAKYKDQLMAILILHMIATHVGLEHDARCYLIDAERLLRNRGLTKNNLSRKARLLHHIYTWTRIVGESTFTMHNYSKSNLGARIERNMHRSQDFNVATQPTTQNRRVSDVDYAQLDDFLRVETHETDSDSDLEAPKDSEVGLRDIHLEDIREDHATLYMQVYGIPEAWLSLVSRTTRLANVIDFTNTSKSQTSRYFSASLQRKTMRLEQMICAFAAESDRAFKDSASSSSLARGSNSVTATDSPRPSCVSHAMMKAMSSALVIFFYRRIRKVHPWILQSHVTDVIEALRHFEQGLAEHSLHGPGTSWPAFMAGCEAMSEVDREWLITWMEKAAKSLASKGIHAALAVVREVWRRRDDTTKTTSGGQATKNVSNWGQAKMGFENTWIDVLRDRKLWLMLY